MTLTTPLVAHFKGVSGRREISLRVVGVNAAGAMVVLWDSKLLAVHSVADGLTLDRVEYVDSTGEVRHKAAGPKPAPVVTAPVVLPGEVRQPTEPKAKKPVVQEAK